MSDTKKITAGTSLGVTLKFQDFENVKPSYWAGLEEVVPADWTDEEIAKRQREIMENARLIVEQEIDRDIDDVKNVKFYELLNMKRSQLKQILGQLFGKK